MCWSPKVKTPKVSMPQTAPTAAPVSDTPASIQFGDDDDKGTEISKTGVGSVKVDLEAEDKNNAEGSTNFGAVIPTGSKATGGSFMSGTLKKSVAGAIRK